MSTRNTRRGPGTSGTSRTDPSKGALPISAPQRRPDDASPPGDGPDLHIEEIEEKQIPKDRNIFDK